MTSKLTVKQSKKDRPKSSDKLKNKKRDGTPDKTTTPNPSQDVLEESSFPARNVIFNDEIASLQIRDEDLQRLHEPRPPSSDKKSPIIQSYMVRKLKPSSEWDVPKPKTVHVLKQAPPDAAVRPVDLSNVGGARLDIYGDIIAHSILGDVESFTKEAVRQGHLQDIPLPPSQMSFNQPLTVKYERKKKFASHVKTAAMNENNALKNWRLKMLERKRQQGYISKLLQISPESLVMNRGDRYREVEEERYIIDRTIPSIDYGKGYRVGSEFWNQQELIGDDLTGIHMTMRQTDKGYPPPIEHIGIPHVIREEKANPCNMAHWQDWPSRCSTPLHHPWDKSRTWRHSEYLSHRLSQLQPIMSELDPHQPIINELQIVGNKRVEPEPPVGMRNNLSQLSKFSEVEQPKEVDPLENLPDVHPTPFIGPSLMFDGRCAQWEGDGTSRRNTLGIEARVTFESYAGDRTTSYLEIVNDGTTSIYYDWKSIPKTNPFDLVNAKVQRFYFNTSPGVILPGDALKFPFIFKSMNAGVYTEQWQFQTKPLVCGGAALLVTLRGVALQEDKYKEKRVELENELATKEATQVVRTILDEILDGIRTPERSRSPIDAYITDAEIFERKNPGRHFKHETVEDLRSLYMEIFPARTPDAGMDDGVDEGMEDGMEGHHDDVVEWDLDINTIEDLIMDIHDEDDDDNRKEDLLLRLNQLVISLSFPPQTPLQQKMYNIGYRLLSDAVDVMVGQSMRLRSTMGLPDHDEELPEEPSGKNSRPSSVISRVESSELSGNHATKPNEPVKTEGKKGAAGGKKDAKSAGGKSAGKDPKQTSKGKEAGGKDQRKGTKTPVRPTSRGATPGPRASSRASQGGSPAPTDKQLENKYKEKLYLQTYSIIDDCIAHMIVVFDEVKAAEDSSNQIQH